MAIYLVFCEADQRAVAERRRDLAYRLGLNEGRAIAARQNVLDLCESIGALNKQVMMTCPKSEMRKIRRELDRRETEYEKACDEQLGCHDEAERLRKCLICMGIL